MFDDVVRLRTSIVVPAYNEAGSIAALLRSILGQELRAAELCEIVVVASGCTDGTHAEVENVARADSRIRLIVQPERLGKVAAINAYLLERDPATDVVVICSADIHLQAGCLEHLVEPFAADPELGMTGGHPVPTNRRGTLLGDMVHLLWELHHDRAVESPKLGEIVAVRSALMDPLPDRSAVDEASAEAAVRARGYELRYIARAQVSNRGPDNLGEYFDQRRRINAGHYWLRRSSGYEPSTFAWRSVLRLALRRVSLRRPRRNLALVVAAAVELAARSAGRLDLWRGHSHSIWKISPSARPQVDAASTASLSAAQLSASIDPPTGG
jgi:poly-beta-1,6-N-acetyl-D-glucosamine synthase